MAFTPISGKDGKVWIGGNSVGETIKWSFKGTANTGRFASSESGGFKRTIAGVKSATGRVEWKFDTLAASPLLEGASATLLLYLNGSLHYIVPCVLANFEVDVDIDSGDPIGASADWESNGQWTEPI